MINLFSYYQHAVDYIYAINVVYNTFLLRNAHNNHNKYKIMRINPLILKCKYSNLF